MTAPTKARAIKRTRETLVPPHGFPPSAEPSAENIGAFLAGQTPPDAGGNYFPSILPARMPGAITCTVPNTLETDDTASEE